MRSEKQYEACDPKNNLLKLVEAAFSRKAEYLLFALY